MQRAVSTKALIADIGGTNARFALAEPGPDDSIRLSEVRTLRTAGFDSLSSAIAAYLEAIQPDPLPRLGAAAVAGPIVGDRVSLTNEAWTFSISEIRRKLKLEPFEVMNDFAAIARSLPSLRADDLHAVGLAEQSPDRIPSGVLAAVGPGTGLGMGVLVQRHGRMNVIPSEGGHISFAPQDALELEICRCLLARFPRLSYESLISGPGLGNLYRALAMIEGTQAEELTPAEIAERGVASLDPLCRRAMEKFCAILGSFAGDVGLMYCADGVYIAGGMVPRFLPFLEESEFRTRFEAKGAFRDMMRQIPTRVILHEQPGLLGAASVLFPAQKIPSREAV